jgi:hypothetical protein
MVETLSIIKCLILVFYTVFTVGIFRIWRFFASNSRITIGPCATSSPRLPIGSHFMKQLCYKLTPSKLLRERIITARSAIRDRIN